MILLSAGHSNTDPGAVSKDGRREADIAVEMRNMVAFYLMRDSKHKVVTDGSGKTNYTLIKALQLIGLAKSDVSIEFHTNAFHLPTAKGVEALSQAKDKALSQALCRSVASNLGTTIRGNNGGWKPENAGQHKTLGFVRKGGIILELFFISNPSELKAWDERKWLVARGVAQTIMKHLA